MMSFAPLHPSVIAEAHKRLAPYIHHTPLLSSQLLNEMLGHEVVFKVEAMQKIGAFKIRGALNTMLMLKEQGKLPQEVVAYSSGNHAQAVALAGKLLGVKVHMLLPGNVSPIKKQATAAYGAHVIATQTRQEAEQKAAEMQAAGMYLIPPYDHDGVIAGQGTACYEALQDGAKPDAIFAPCGGGGLMSGTWLAAQLLAPDAKTYAAEPLEANDAAQSYRQGSIVRFEEAPKTIADGVRTLAISERTFHYLKQLDGFYEISERDIVYWTQWLMHLLKVTVEPTSALGMAAACAWFKTQKQKRRALVILSGGNLAPETYRAVWEKDYLVDVPRG